MTALEQEILDIINEVVRGNYVGKLRVTVDEDGYHTLLLYLNMEISPMAMGHPGPEEEFKQYIRDEFRNRRMERVRHWTGYMELPGHDGEDDCGGEDWNTFEIPTLIL